MAGAVPASAQPPAAAATAAEDLGAARERVKANSVELSKFTVPMSTEPAFAFQA